MTDENARQLLTNLQASVKEKEMLQICEELLKSDFANMACHKFLNELNDEFSALNFFLQFSISNFQEQTSIKFKNACLEYNSMFSLRFFGLLCANIYKSKHQHNKIKK